MADNIAITAGAGTDIATDDISGKHYQRNKLIHGVDGTNDGDVARTNPFPVASEPQSNSIMVGAVQATPKFALISASSSSTVTIVAAVTSAKLRVLDYVLVVRGTCSTTFNSSVTPQTGVMVLDSGAAPGYNPLGHFQTLVGQPLTITVGDKAAGGHLLYVEVSA